MTITTIVCIILIVLELVNICKGGGGEKRVEDYCMSVEILDVVGNGYAGNGWAQP